MNKKQLYAAPETEVLELTLEYNVLQATSKIDSSELPGWGDGGEL